MYEQRIPIEGAARLTLSELAGNADVSGWDRAEVLVRLESDPNQVLHVERSAEELVLIVRTNCELRVPAGLLLHIRQALGNLRVENVADLNAEQVRGNLRLDNVSRAHLAEVYGNLKVDEATDLQVVGTVYGQASVKDTPRVDLQNVRGDVVFKDGQRLRVSRIGGNLQVKELHDGLEADQVGGNVTLKDIDGPVAIDQVAGNMAAREVTGGARVPRIGGNLLLSGALGRGRTYHFQADGNALLRLPEDAGVHLALTARGRITSSLPLTAEERSEGHLRGVLGDGGCELTVEAGGNVMVGGDGHGIRVDIDLDLGHDFSREIEDSLRAVDLEAIGRQVSQEMDAAMSRLRVKLESTDWQRFGLQAQQAVERAMDHLQRDMDRAAEKAAHYQERLARYQERAARRQERQIEQDLRREQGTTARPPAGGEAPPQTEADALEEWDWQEGQPDRPLPVETPLDLDQERLSILRLVEQGQISPAEAEMLLDALG